MNSGQWMIDTLFKVQGSRFNVGANLCVRPIQDSKIQRFNCPVRDEIWV